jgi:phosphoribosylglycinamide formyltransferase-1
VIGVLVSGRGTNLQALLDAGLPVVAVASSRPGVEALDRAHRADVETAVFALEDYADRDARDLALADWLEGRLVDVVVTAGFMQLLQPLFVERFRNRIVNVHPALLPAFPGRTPVEDALAHGAKVTGVTVHLVDGGVDSGPILLQECVAVEPGDTAETLHARIQAVEHRLLPEAVRLLLDGRVQVDGRKVMIA